MPNIKSSKKDVISSKIAYEKNKANKTALKSVLKKFDAALESGDKTAAEAAYAKTVVIAIFAIMLSTLLPNTLSKHQLTRRSNRLAIKKNIIKDNHHPPVL